MINSKKRYQWLYLKKVKVEFYKFKFHWYKFIDTVLMVKEYEFITILFWFIFNLEINYLNYEIMELVNFVFLILKKM